MKHSFVGIHSISDFYDIERKLFGQEFLRFVQDACDEHNFTVLDSSVYIFDNGGFTLFVLLAESHISFHYYIENDAAFVDIFTCGINTPVQLLNDLRKYCNPKRENLSTINRGDLHV